MNKIKNRKKPCDVNVRSNGKVTELMGTNINFELKILILNFEFKISITVIFT